MDDLDRLKILFKSKLIKEMCIEDLEIWEGFEKIYPSYVRFPESFEFNRLGYCNRTKEIKYLKKIIKNIDKIINGLFSSSELIKKMRRFPVKRSKEVEKFIRDEEKKLKLHIKGLKKLRQKRLEEFAKSQKSEVKE